ncbi:MAG TPA: transcription termination/antitermination NusG family protein [Pyrinomonadaceae bacterium]|nr:transcription termination/antitermination NusG family protein [Pyrinomonadaceae bacterium]
MIRPPVEDDPRRWYVIHTKVSQEERARSNLQSWQVETFAPLLKTRRVNQYTRKVGYRVGPLFPRYIFARFHSDTLLHKVRFTRGIQNVVSFGGEPSPVDDEIIAVLKSRVQADGFVLMEKSSMKPGDRVVINSGPLEGFNGIFEEEVKTDDRIRILLTTVCYQARLVVERGVVQLASERG